ncbi:MAG TPA: ACP phosphodiesterase, partial [Bacteroidales bacterium]|nr:ACP phosphodiesterase [Bacteroidales bacterium]
KSFYYIYNLSKKTAIYRLEKVLSRMALRTSLPHHTATCMQILRSNYTELEHNFNDFFPELQKYVLTL